MNAISLYNDDQKHKRQKYNFVWEIYLHNYNKAKPSVKSNGIGKKAEGKYYQCQFHLYIK